MSMIPEEWQGEVFARLSDQLTQAPAYYTPLRMRDRRWLWLRKKTILVPHYRPIRRIT